MVWSHIYTRVNIQATLTHVNLRVYVWRKRVYLHIRTVICKYAHFLERTYLVLSTSKSFMYKCTDECMQTHTHTQIYTKITPKHTHKHGRRKIVFESKPYKQQGIYMCNRSLFVYLCVCVLRWLRVCLFMWIGSILIVFRIAKR